MEPSAALSSCEIICIIQHGLHQPQGAGDEVPQQDVPQGVGEQDAGDEQHDDADQNLVGVERGPQAAQQQRRAPAEEGGEELVLHPVHAKGGEVPLQPADQHRNAPGQQAVPEIAAKEDGKTGSSQHTAGKMQSWVRMLCQNGIQLALKLFYGRRRCADTAAPLD